MGFVWIGERILSFGSTDYDLPDWAKCVILGVLFVAICALIGFMFMNSRASAIINCVFMTVNLFLLFFSIGDVKFVNPYDLQMQDAEAFKQAYALGTWIWGLLVFAMASLSITANVHTFFTDGRYESLYIDQHGRVGTETKGLDESQKTALAFFIVLGISAAVVALGIYCSMWWLQGYSIALLALSIIQIIVTFILHEKLDD